VAGRHRTCAPRVSSGRSTVLSYGHGYGRGWIRTSDLLFVRQALNRSELLARAEKVGGAGVESGYAQSYIREVLSSELPAQAPGQGLESGYAPRYVRAWRPAVRRSRNVSYVCLARLMPNDVVHATRLPFNPGSSLPACPPATTSSYVEELWSPHPRDRREIRRRKQTSIRQRNFLRERRGVFLSQAGPRFDLVLLQAGHHLMSDID
jgi:hypothetical protein